MKIARRVGRRAAAIEYLALNGRCDEATRTWPGHATVLFLSLLLIAAVPAVVWGQPSGGGDVPDEKVESYAKIIRAQAVLIELPMMFQQDTELEAMRSAYVDALEKTMTGLDPRTAQRMSRLSELQTQAMAGSSSEGSLLEEGRELRDALLSTAAQARQQPSVSKLEKPLVVALKDRVDGLAGVDADTKELVTTGDLLIDVVTTMSILSQ